MTSSAGKWVRTEDRLPTDKSGGQVFILMWSPQWATWIHGMYTHYGDASPETGAWAMYDPSEDRFYDWPEAPEWWCEVELPETPRKDKEK